MKLLNFIIVFAPALQLTLAANVDSLSSLLIHPVEVAVPTGTTIVPNTHCENIGEYHCTEKYKVMECGVLHQWEELHCPDGCNSEATFMRCRRHMTKAASHVPRNDSPCKPKSRACDSERRFVFECGDDGHWGEGRQCSRAGACKVQKNAGLICTGHPHFYYDDNRVCERERSCELMGYWYCLAGSGENNKAKAAECLARMCGMEDCHDCDRCSFKLGPGQKICPDLSTLWLG